MVKKIIIVDDDPDFLSWLKFGLQQNKEYAVLTAETKTEGLYLVQNEVPDIVILDILLPDGDGYEFCKQIKQFRSNLPVILVTGIFKEHEAWEKGLKAGVDDLLIKPFSYERLTVQIQKQLKKYDNK